jgi:hypothetical protein
MSSENDTTINKATKSKGEGPPKFERIELRRNIMGDDNFWYQVSKSFPCLYEADKDKMCGKMYSACTARRKKRDAPHKLCPVLKLAAHAFSASLVQGKLRDEIAEIEKIQAIIEDINRTYFTPEMPRFLGEVKVGPEIKDYNNNVIRFIQLFKSRYRDDAYEDYFHLLRINQEISRLWGNDQTWEQLQNECTRLLKSLPKGANNDFTDEGLSLALSVLIMSEVLKRLKADENQDPSLKSASDVSYISVVNSIVGLFYRVRNKLQQIDEQIRKEHERAYTTTFSQSAFTAPPLEIHPYFDRAVLDIANRSKMWDPAPLEATSEPTR